MPTILDCPSCGRKLRVADDLAGQQVKCPTCGAVFEPDAAPAPATAPAPEPAPREAPPEPGPEDEYHECPHCGARVRAGARRCRSCDADLDAEEDDERPWEAAGRILVRRDCEPH